MGTIIQNFRPQAGTNCHAIRAEKGNGRKAESGKTDSRSAIMLNDTRTPGYADCNTRRVIAAAASSALRVVRRRPYGYLLAATLMSASSLVQSQRFSASIRVSDLDGRNGFANKSINIRSAKARVYKSQKRSAIESTKRRHRG